MGALRINVLPEKEKARIVGTKDQMQVLSEVVACLSALLPSLTLLVQGGCAAVPERNV